MLFVEATCPTSNVAIVNAWTMGHSPQSAFSHARHPSCEARGQLAAPRVRCSTDRSHPRVDPALADAEQKLLERELIVRGALELEVALAHCEQRLDELLPRVARL